MEDSYGGGVEDLSSAAAELAGARMAEQKRLQEEMRRLRGIQPGDRVKVRVRLGAPVPEVVQRFHYASPFGGVGLGHRRAAAAAATRWTRSIRKKHPTGRGDISPTAKRQASASSRTSSAKRRETTRTFPSARKEETRRFASVEDGRRARARGVAAGAATASG